MQNCDKQQKSTKIRNKGRKRGLPPGRSRPSSVGRIWDLRRPSNSSTSRDLQPQRTSPLVRKGIVYVFPGIHLMPSITDVPSSPSLAEAPGAVHDVPHRPAASNSSSAAAANFQSFKVAPIPNRWSYSAALRTQASYMSSASSTRSTASGSAPIAPSTPTSGLVEKVRRRQTKANRRFSLESKVVRDLLYVLLQSQLD